MIFTITHLIIAVLTGFALGILCGWGIFMLRAATKSSNTQQPHNHAQHPTTLYTPVQPQLPDPDRTFVSKPSTTTVQIKPPIDAYDTMDGSLPSTRLHINHEIEPDTDSEDLDELDAESNTISRAQPPVLPSWENAHHQGGHAYNFDTVPIHDQEDMLDVTQDYKITIHPDILVEMEPSPPELPMPPEPPPMVEDDATFIDTKPSKHDEKR